MIIDAFDEMLEQSERQSLVMGDCPASLYRRSAHSACATCAVRWRTLRNGEAKSGSPPPVQFSGISRRHAASEWVVSRKSEPSPIVMSPLESTLQRVLDDLIRTLSLRLHGHPEFWPCRVLSKSCPRFEPAIGVEVTRAPSVWSLAVTMILYWMCRSIPDDSLPSPWPRYRTAFSVAYGGGLRANEVTHLEVGNVDSDRMLIRAERQI